MAIIIKTPEQIEGIRKSCQLSAKGLNYLEKLIEPGITTKFLADRFDAFLKDHGASSATLGYKGYPGSCCISVNDVICHGIPSDSVVLKEGDIVSIDVSNVLDGYYGDTCGTFGVGEISPESRQLIDVTKACLMLGVEQCFGGNRLNNIGYEITKHAKQYGYSVVFEFCGHGVGIKFHEEPEVQHCIYRPNEGPVLKPGWIFTVEPMINAGKSRVKIDKKDGWTARTLDGKLSAQFEHTVLITSGAPEILTLEK